MKKEEYEVLFNIEDDHWWYVGLRKLVLSFVYRINNRRENSKILDAGCGTGRMLSDCKGYKTYGMDFSEEALRFCKLRKLENLVKGSISSVPFKECTFDIIVSLDVLYHKGVENDVEALKELYRAMKKDGILMLNLAAYDFLKSRHDEAVHTKRRYTKKNLKEKVKKAGFEIEKITYRNTFLLPIAIIKRIIEKIFLHKQENAESDLKRTPYLVNKLLTYLVLLENKLIRFGINFPFGLSVYCVARKNS